MSVLRRPRNHGLTALIVVSLAAGCSSVPPGYQLVRPTSLDQAVQEVPEDQLLDVGVEISEARALSEKQLEKLGTNTDIRKSECRYIPYHLKTTLQQSSHWGAVQVVPPEGEVVDLTISSELVKSNGEMLQLEVNAVDAAGRVWLSRKYHAQVKQGHYTDTSQGEREAFQDLYNTVANDLAAFKHTLPPATIADIRTVSKLQFAQEFAPEAFDDYLSEDEQGLVVVQHFPAQDDPQMERIELIRERDNMFVETLNQYYEGLYLNMWEAYENWRQFNLVEQVALREAKKEAFFRTVTGILMVAAAVALQVGDLSPSVGVASGVLLAAGGQVIISGVNISQQADIHAEAIRELSESFGAEMRPTVLELEGKQYELTGTAAEQYREWKSLMRRIYYEETGFDPDVTRFGSADHAPAELPAVR